MVVIAGRKVSSLLVVFVSAVVGAGLCLLGLNYYHTLNCAVGQSTEETADFIQALNRRLLEAESEVIRNSVLMNKVIYAIQNNLVKLEAKEYEDLSRDSRDEAVRVALFLASHPAPPMPIFAMESGYDDPEKLADIIDDIFGKGDTKYAEGLSEYTEPAISLSDEEAVKICTEWKDTYKVVVGVSWGDLPYDLQQKWVEYGCDYHMRTVALGGDEPDGGEEFPFAKEESEEGEEKDTEDPLIQF